MAQIETTPDMVKKIYEKTRQQIGIVRERLGRPMTLAEKIIAGHLASWAGFNSRREFSSSPS